MNRNVQLLARMDVFLQAVIGLPVDEAGRRTLPPGGLEGPREMSSDAYFAGDATPEARMVKKVGSFIDEVDALDMDSRGSRVVPGALVERARDLARQSLAVVQASGL